MKTMNVWNVIFLLNKNPPTKILFLKRSPTRTFAPNLYTGVGGKVEEKETLLESAYRELEEETGITNVTLEHFAKVVIDREDVLHYFQGIYPNIPKLPNSNEGTLEWVPAEQVFDKDIIPTTLEMLKYWQSQNWNSKPFTLNVGTISERDGVKQVRIKRNLAE